MMLDHMLQQGWGGRGKRGGANMWWDSDEKRKQRRQSLIAFSVINRVPHLMKH